jgi:hypothetical protein
MNHDFQQKVNFAMARLYCYPPEKLLNTKHFFSLLCKVENTQLTKTFLFSFFVIPISDLFLRKIILTPSETGENVKGDIENLQRKRR